MHIFYSGNVQGVGFRYTTKNAASGYEVVGIVRNLKDGRVELVAEGTKEELEAFQTGIREAGLGHFIKNEELVWEEPSGEFRGFEIRQ
jgi:acylphosphatase